MSALAVVTKPASQNTDDLDLVAAVRAGDERAFDLLYARYQSRIAAYVRGMVRDHGRAEDITQEVFIAALRRMRETDREIAFKPWIYEIAKNACIDAYRRTRNTSEVSLDAEDALGPADHGRLAAAGSAPDVVIDTKLAIDNLCGAFGGLSQTHHDILVMREFDGLSYREIGDRLGMSRAGVESTLFRARRRLGEEYEELVSGERCVRVRAIVDAPAARVAGLRDRRRLARHVSHCQPCRRYALRAGVDVAAVRAPASVASKIAALLPLPSFLRRRLDADVVGGQMLGVHGNPALHVVSTLDPATVSSWSKAVVTAATVVVAGLGTGAAVEHDSVMDFVRRAPGIIGLAPGGSPERGSPSQIRSLAPDEPSVRLPGPGADGAGQRPQRGEPGSTGPADPEVRGQAPGSAVAEEPSGETPLDASSTPASSTLAPSTSEPSTLAGSTHEPLTHAPSADASGVDAVVSSTTALGSGTALDATSTQAPDRPEGGVDSLLGGATGADATVGAVTTLPGAAGEVVAGGIAGVGPAGVEQLIPAIGNGAGTGESADPERDGNSVGTGTRAAASGGVPRAATTGSS